jgi:hypothetical protein
MTMAERVASAIHRRAWANGRRFICKSVCDKICDSFFRPDIKHNVWSRLNGTETPREDVPVSDLEHALRFLGSTSSDERWLALEEPLPEAFDAFEHEPEFDFFADDEYWTCDEDFCTDLDTPEEPVCERNKRTLEDPKACEDRATKRPKRDKKVKPIIDVCDWCHGNGCVRCGWKKNMW